MEEADEPGVTADAASGADPEVTPTPIPDVVLRSALEFAVDIAAAGVKLRPPLPFPNGLKPFLRLQRLPAAAYGRVRRAIEDDPVFLERLGSVATRELVDEIGVLWLSRPVGWRSTVDGLLAAQQPVAEVDVPARREARRREAAEQAAARARSALADAEHHARQARAAHQDERARAATIAAQLATEQRRSAELTAKVERLTAEVGRTRAALADAEAARDEAAGAVAAAEQARDNALAARAAGPAPAPSVAAEVAAGRGALDDAAARRLVQRARRGAQEVERLVAELGALIGDGPAVAWLGEPATLRRPATQPATAPPGRRGRRPARNPLPIPGGLYGHSAAVTEHLLRTPGVVVLVDGYNVAKLGWPGLDLQHQREVCIDAAEDVARRWGTAITVVFDGADVPGASAARRRLVRVVFSPAGVIADDVLRSEVESIDAATPIVLVSNDQALVADVRSAGANSVTSDQFLAIARR